jgi:hypothetical protein
LRDERFVVGVVGVGRIDAKEPKAPRQRAEVHVKHESRLGQRLRSAHNVDPYPVAVRGTVPRLGRPAVDDQGANLGQRHPERLHDVPERGEAIARQRDRPLPVRRPQEEAQLGGDVELSSCGVHPSSMRCVPRGGAVAV